MSITDRLSAIGEMVASIQRELDDLASIFGLEKIETSAVEFSRAADKKAKPKKQTPAKSVTGKKRAGRPKGSTKAAIAAEKRDSQAQVN